MDVVWKSEKHWTAEQLKVYVTDFPTQLGQFSAPLRRHYYSCHWRFLIIKPPLIKRVRLCPLMIVSGIGCRSPQAPLIDSFEWRACLPEAGCDLHHTVCTPHFVNTSRTIPRREVSPGIEPSHETVCFISTSSRGTLSTWRCERHTLSTRRYGALSPRLQNKQVVSTLLFRPLGLLAAKIFQRYYWQLKRSSLTGS